MWLIFYLRVQMGKQSEAYSTKQTWLPTLSLFTSVGTLLCCALPALLVTIGAGASLAGLVSAAPWLVTLSKYKVWTFAVSALIMTVSGFMIWRARNMPCPIDPTQAKACLRLRKISLWLFLSSVLVWFIGFFFAFVAVHLFY